MHVFSGVTTYCLHPGPVNTKLLYDMFNPFLKPIHSLAACIVMKVAYQHTYIFTKTRAGFHDQVFNLSVNHNFC